MGLDMYLTGKEHIWNHESEEWKYLQKVTKSAPFKVNSVEVEVGYWRKANAIHNWFVRNVQNDVDDCGTYYLEMDTLKKLRVDAKKALKSSAPEKEMPTHSGFFFGGTEYDEYYKEQLKYTIEMVDKIEKAQAEKKYDFYYHSSW